MMTKKKKQCVLCKRWLPNNKEYFYKDDKAIDGLSFYCKICKGQYNTLYYYNGNRTNRSNKKRKVCKRCGEEYPATEKHFYRHGGCFYGVRNICKECERKEYEKKKKRKTVHEKFFNLWGIKREIEEYVKEKKKRGWKEKKIFKGMPYVGIFYLPLDVKYSYLKTTGGYKDDFITTKQGRILKKCKIFSIDKGNTEFVFYDDFKDKLAFGVIPSNKIIFEKKILKEV